MGLAVFVVEEVGEDRGSEAGIVELDRQLVTSFVRALGPGGTDFRAAHKDPVRGALSLSVAASGMMRTFLVCTLIVTISPWKSLPTFLKEPIFAMLCLLGLVEPALFAALMAGSRQGDVPAAPERAAAKRRTAQHRVSCFARNGRRRGPHRVSDGVARPRGRKLGLRRCGKGK